jgi:DNA polymerase-3 subunit gamma/tau
VPRGRPAAPPEPAPEPPESADWEPELEDEPDLSDPDLEDASLVGAPLVEKLLGATLIDDIPLEPPGPRAAERDVG